MSGNLLEALVLLKIGIVLNGRSFIDDRRIRLRFFWTLTNRRELPLSDLTRCGHAVTRMASLTIFRYDTFLIPLYGSRLLSFIEHY